MLVTLLPNYIRLYPASTYCYSFALPCGQSVHSLHICAPITGSAAMQMSGSRDEIVVLCPVPGVAYYDIIQTLSCCSYKYGANFQPVYSQLY